MPETMPDGLTLSVDKQFLFFKQATSLSGITTNLFGDNSFQDDSYERGQSRRLKEMLQAQAYQKLMVKHGDSVVLLKSADTAQDNYHEADALICNHPDKKIILMSNTGDCPIITLTDIDQNFIAIIHSGKACTNLNIIGKTIDLIQDRLPEVFPGRILACLWPGIHYEAYRTATDDPHICNIKMWMHKDCLNLKAAIMNQMDEAGILLKHINSPNLYSSSTIGEISFFSYRLKKNYERNVVFITNTILKS